MSIVNSTLQVLPVGSNDPGTYYLGLMPTTKGRTPATYASIGASYSPTTGTLNVTATRATYADLAENYQADKQYMPGTVLQFGGVAEVTVAEPDTTRVAGIVSTNPAHLMNGSLQGSSVVPLALLGRVPCMIIGPVAKGDILVSAGFGYAKANNTPAPGQAIGKALEDFVSVAKGMIEVAIGKI